MRRQIRSLRILVLSAALVFSGFATTSSTEKNHR
jgi:hypothetical protein